jgi:hypothetical protein
MFPKVSLLEETMKGGKEEKNDKVNNIEIFPICACQADTLLLEPLHQPFPYSYIEVLV